MRDLTGIYIVAKFGTDLSIFADAGVYTKSNMANFLIQGQITRTVLDYFHNGTHTRSYSHIHLDQVWC